ncbi:hypothetical protein [Ktedonospora formicarum]|nr:hypothetical protein [Ktedonospora formicarum]
MTEDQTNTQDVEDDNWLNRQRITCPACQRPLERIDHSPFIDYHYLYCDTCPIHVEVCYYDETFQALDQAASRENDSHTSLMRVIEARLKPCACGGSFKHDAPRRCFTCHAPVIIDDAAGIDLWPPEEEVDEEQEAEWWPRFTRADDLWRDTL